MSVDDFYEEYNKLEDYIEELQLRGRQLQRLPMNNKDKELACHVECLNEALNQL